MKTEKQEFQKALKTVTEYINENNDLRYGYQANIAVAFQDECHNNGVEFDNLHKVSNNAANNFLNTWINDVKNEENEKL